MSNSCYNVKSSVIPLNYFIRFSLVEVDPRKVLIIAGHHNYIAIAYAHFVCCYRYLVISASHVDAFFHVFLGQFEIPAILDYVLIVDETENTMCHNTFRCVNFLVSFVSILLDKE